MNIKNQGSKVADKTKITQKIEKSEKSLEVYQNLLTQLNGLEKLVRDAKKELSKFENCGEDLNDCLI